MTQTALKNVVSKITNRFVSGLVTAALALSPVMPLLLTAKVAALDTPVLFPAAQGFYTAWENGESTVDETDTPSCSSSDYIREGTNNDRESVTIDLSGIPDNSTITSVSVQVTYRADDSNAANGTFKTFTRLNNTDLDSATNITATNETCTAGSQTLDVADTVKSGSTTLEVGVVKTGASGASANLVRVGTLRAVVTYTAAPQLQPDLVVTKANNVSGNVTVGNTFQWTLTVTNQGTASATFNNHNILEDDLPTTANYSPDTNMAVTTGGGVTGTIDCDISSDTLDCDDDSGGSTVVIPVSGWFSVTFTVTPDGVGTLTNPRSGETCKADPGSIITEVNENNNDCSNSVTVSDIPVTTNPTLPQACGLDIALVIDNSGSIDSGELTQMKNAMTAFTGALNGTPTHFSVTKFATESTVVQPFTANITDVNNAINAIPVDEGSTNWQQGLTKAQTTLPHRSNPNLVIFASDGNPNRTGTPATTVSESEAVSAAKLVSNSIKSGGSRILALGIGSDLDTPNLQAISGPNTNTGNVLTSDVITTDFANLAAQLATFAQQTCGGTITVKKVIDADGLANTTNDRTPAATWSFNVGGQANQITDANGFTPAVTLTAGSGYSVTETVKSGYAVMSASCTGAANNGSLNGSAVTGITINNTNIVTCTFVNKAVGTITLVKSVTNNNGGTAVANDFGLTIGGTSVTSGQVLNVNAGSYAINEAGKSGYQFVSITGTGCPAQLGGNVTVAAGQNITCTITNDDIAPSLTLNKVLVKDNGGTATESNWTLNAVGSMASPTNLSGPGAAGSTDVVSGSNLKAGTYTLSETGGPSGYSANAWTCTNSVTVNASSQITLALGQTTVCSITNNDIAPILTLIKTVTNDNGGLLQVSNFVLRIDGNQVTSGLPNVLNAGAHTATEDANSAYQASNWTGDCATNGSITLSVGDNKTCYITNNDKPGTLIVKKVVTNNNGGNKTANQFSFSVNGGSTIAFEADGQNDLTVNVGTYTVTETPPTGYTVSYSGCNQVAIANGETKTCTITNDDIAPKLTLVKTVTNNNGGNAVVADFPLFINGNQVTSGVKNTLTANVLYTATETNLAGYTPSTWSGDCATNGTVTLQPGDDKTCYITNDDVAPTITLIKSVTKDNNGTAGVNDFGLTIGGVATNSGDTKTVNANTPIALNEVGLSGYSFVSITGDAKCPQVLGGTVTLNEGENITCTITNDDVAPGLTLIKWVTNNNGGLLQVTDFLLYVGATNVGSGVSNLFNAGAYLVSEVNKPGYTAGNWSGDCDEDGNITLQLGQNYTCEITNDDVAPTLKLVKKVVNSYGQAESASSWTLTATPAANDKGAAEVSSAGGFGPTNVFANIEYTLTESTGPSGYTASGWSCDGGTLAGNKLTLALDADVICEITNTAQAPSLTVVKRVVNDNGGAKDADDFGLTINGNSLSFGAGVADGTNTLAYTATPSISSDTEYTLTEQDTNGYTEGLWYCVNGQGQAVGKGGDLTAIVEAAEGVSITCTITNNDDPGKLIVKKELVKDNGGNESKDDFAFTVNNGSVLDFEADGQNEYTVNAGTYSVVEETANGYSTTYDNCNNVAVANGETETCIITNDDIAPTITLIKSVTKNNGGTAGVNDFGLTIGGTATDSGDTKTVSANAAIALNEAGLFGYDFVSITGDEKCPATLGGTVTLDEGEDITCTITNDDVSPTLTLIKWVTNNSGGLLQVTDFLLYVGAINVTSGASNLFNAGAYLVNELNKSGYTASGWSGDCDTNGNVTLQLGLNYTCEITNDDQPAKIKVTKVVVNDNGGEAEAKHFTLKVNDTTVVSGETNEFNGNASYTISENDMPYGYVQTGITCVDTTAETSVGNQFTAALGHNYECTVTNDDVSPKLTITKKTLPGESAQTFNFASEDLDGFSLAGGENKTFDGLQAGSYTITEEATEGWKLIGITCEGGQYATEDNFVLVSLSIGDEVTCEFTNEQLNTVRGHKFNDINGNHVWDENEPALANWTITLTEECDAEEAIVYLLDIRNDEYEDECAPVTESTVTDEDGAYSFSSLEPGTYTVCEVQKATWAQTFPQDNDGCHEVVIEGPGEVVTADFGNRAKPQVLGETLVNTGSAANTSMLVGLTILVVLSALHLLTRRKNFES